MKPVLVGIGELLWDLLPEGRHVGGAPANFAYFAKYLGARGIVVSRVGSDDLGRELIRYFNRISLSVRYIPVDEKHPTGTAMVALDSYGKPRFKILPNVAWDFISRTTELSSLVKRADAVCFGTLAQRQPLSRDTIQWLLNQTPDNMLRVFDVNLRPPYVSPEIIKTSMKLANVVKLNDEELKVIARILHLSGNEDTLLRLLSRAYDLRLVALTKGENGSILYSHGKVSEGKGILTDVVDTVGAGDAFTAAMVLGLLHNLDLDTINHYANKVATYVCSQHGATPLIPEYLRVEYLRQKNTRLVHSLNEQN